MRYYFNYRAIRLVRFILFNYCKKMTLILLIWIMIIVYMLVHLWIMYLHAKYKLFEDEETVAVIHCLFWIIWALLILSFICFIASL